MTGKTKPAIYSFPKDSGSHFAYCRLVLKEQRNANPLKDLQINQNTAPKNDCWLVLYDSLELNLLPNLLSSKRIRAQWWWKVTSDIKVQSKKNKHPRVIWALDNHMKSGPHTSLVCCSTCREMLLWTMEKLTPKCLFNETLVHLYLGHCLSSLINT